MTFDANLLGLILVGLFFILITIATILTSLLFKQTSLRNRLRKDMI